MFLVQISQHGFAQSQSFQREHAISPHAELIGNDLCLSVQAQCLVARHFFDEAQFESYRELGYLSGVELGEALTKTLSRSPTVAVSV